MFGTDLPGTRARRAFEAADVDIIADAVGDDLEAVLGGNAREWYAARPDSQRQYRAQPQPDGSSAPNSSTRIAAPRPSWRAHVEVHASRWVRCRAASAT